MYKKEIYIEAHGSHGTFVFRCRIVKILLRVIQVKILRGCGRVVSYESLLRKSLCCNSREIHKTTPPCSTFHLAPSFDLLEVGSLMMSLSCSESGGSEIGVQQRVHAIAREDPHREGMKRLDPRLEPIQL